MLGKDWPTPLLPSSACCFPHTEWPQHLPQTPVPALTPSISATGPLEERQIAYVCREALKVAGPIRLLTPQSRGAVGREPSWPVCGGGGGAGLRGGGSWGERAPALLPEAAHFPLGSVTSCLGRGEEEAAWVGGPSPGRGLRGGDGAGSCSQGLLSVPRGCTTCIRRARSTETSR